MSMDLAKKTFSTEPDYLIAGTAEINTAVKVAAAAVKRGAPVILDNNGKAAQVPTTSSGDNIKAKTDGLYGIVADDAEADEEVVIYLSGEFFGDSLVLPENVTVDALEVAFRNIGIYLK